MATKQVTTEEPEAREKFFPTLLRCMSIAEIAWIAHKAKPTPVRATRFSLPLLTSAPAWSAAARF